MEKYIIILLVPALILACGVISLNRPPKQINSFYGYRTPRSMRDKRSWDYAQSMMSEYFIYYSLLSLVISAILAVLSRIFFDRDYIPCLIMLLQCIGIFAVIVRVENNLKKEHKRWDEK